MSAHDLLILGIESTCDETAAGVVRRAAGGKGTILADVVRSQLAEHAPYGGVVPELAARAHVEAADQVIAMAMRDASLNFSDLDGIAAAAGPGLIGGVIVGLTTAKAIALVHDLPLLCVNHLEAHALTARLTDEVAFPYLLLLVSGGHTQLLWVQDVGRYRRLGTTIDDALGEAFDKVAKLLGLGYPGGPEVERMAERGDRARFGFPRPLSGRAEPHFSFSGLKTAVRIEAERLGRVGEQDIADICASFQQAVCDSVADRLGRAIEISRAMSAGRLRLVVAGGVAANAALRAAIETVAEKAGARLFLPSPHLCTDNGVIIAWAGAERLARGESEDLDAPPRARWPLDPDAAPAPGAGVKA